MLVAAFGVEVGAGSWQLLGSGLEDGVGAGAGLEPDVEDVHLFAEFGVAAGAGGAGGEQLGGRGRTRRRRIPYEEVDDELVDGGVFERLAALSAEEDGDGDAPDALAGDAPVGAGGDHVGDALLAPGGVPGDAFDFVEGALAEGGLRASLWVAMGVSMAMNHCSVARVMTGLWQRQQCG